jgi:hypothetical protein
MAMPPMISGLTIGRPGGSNAADLQSRATAG